MERYLKRKVPGTGTGTGGGSSTDHASDKPISSATKKIDLNDLPWDPADRKKISEYHPSQRDEIRRSYMIRGPYQPRGYNFPKKMIGKKLRRFNPAWFYQYSTWLEYSLKEDKAFCLCCYLFRDHNDKQAGNDAFVTDGFASWNKTERLVTHVGGVNSFHNRALEKYDVLMRRGPSVGSALCKQGDMVKNECLSPIPLSASVNVSRHVLLQELPCDGHDESKESSISNTDNVLKMIKYTSDQLRNTLGNVQVVSPNIQKDVVHCFEEEIGDDVFGLLIDEFRDISNKEQISVVLRYVDKCGIVKERCVGVAHVMEISDLSLKSTIDSLFATFGLNYNKVRSQGYNGACNMRDEFNGLRALIAKENCSAYYVHCSAHQLQSVIVAIAKEHFKVGNFFDMICVLLNVIGASCNPVDTNRQSHQEKVQQAFSIDEIKIGTRLNQEYFFQGVRDDHYSYHYKILLNLVELFSLIVEVVEYVEVYGKVDYIRRQAYSLLVYFQSFDFVFTLHLMFPILGYTNPLSLALERKDYDILNAISLVKVTKRLLHKVRDDGWDSLLKKVSCFCEEHDISMLNMEEEFVNPKKPRQRTNITNLHHYMVDCFNIVIDMQLKELNDCFNEVNSELLTCTASLSPSNSFREFDPVKLMRLAEFYPDDFNFEDRMTLEHQLAIYIDNVHDDERFANLKGISDLAKVMVETKKHLSFDLVYRLLKLALILPVATAAV